MNNNNDESDTNSENDTEEDTYVSLGPNHTREEEYENRRKFTLRIKIRKLRNERRLQNLLKYTKCKITGCTCVGWRKHTGRHSFVPWYKQHLIDYMNKDTGMMDFSSNCSKKPVNESLSPCKRCGHRFSSHTPRKFWAVNVADELLRAAIDMRVLLLNAREAQDTVVKEMNVILYKLIRYSLANSMSPWELIIHGAVPYARTPLIKVGETVIADGVIRHVNQRNVNAPTYVKDLNYELGTTYLKFVNTTIYQFPQETMASTGVRNLMYEEEFGRWLLYCHIPVLCGSLPYDYAARVMGLIFLCHQYERLRRRMACFIHEPVGRQLMSFSEEFYKKIISGDRYIWTGDKGDLVIPETQPHIVSEMLRSSERPMGDGHISWYPHVF